MLRFLMLMLLGLLVISPSFAAYSDRNVSTTLARIINQLDAILPLIEQGEKEQARQPQKAVRFHFTGFVTQDKQYHQGLKEDVLAMRQSIVKAIHQTPVAAQAIQPLSLDYIDNPVKKPHVDQLKSQASVKE